ncbi:hypothetical protein [Methanocalculus natronophilus]
MDELRGLDKTIQELKAIITEQEKLLERSGVLIKGVMALYRTEDK